jgi:hypothetical protein
LPKRYFSKLLEPASLNNLDAGQTAEPTWGLAVPRKGSKTACLCEDGQTYSRKCCRERLIQQGIGKTQGEALPTYAFKRPDFSNAWS